MNSHPEDPCRPAATGVANRRGLVCSLLILVTSTLTGCRMFDYTEADMERERRLISGYGSEPCRDGCWHAGHGFGGGYGGDFGPLHPALGPISLPASAFGKKP